MTVIITLGLIFFFIRIILAIAGFSEQREVSWTQVETEWKECPACNGTGGTKGKYMLCCMYCTGAGGALVKARSKK